LRPPISIVLTTLAAQNYGGHTSVFEAMSVILNGIVSMIPDLAEGRLKVENPTNPEEDLSERWEDEPEAYVAFVSWINTFRAEWEALSKQHGTGLHKIKVALEKMFGERVAKEVVEEYIRSFDEPRQTGQLAVEKGTGLIVPATSSAATMIPRNTFYGDE
jgi:predicted ATP-binding protein involved in virulence